MVMTAEQRRCLIVEPDKNIRAFLSEGLSNFHISTVAVEKSDEAERVLQGPEQDTFDVIVFNPESSIDLLYSLRKKPEFARHAQTTVVALTARDDQDTKVACKTLGVDVFLYKPVEANEFLQTVDKAAKREK
jgi:DNA-binding response OmpR family regulator